MVNKVAIGEIRKYFREIKNIYLRGDYTEWSYRTPFENFIEGLNPDYNLVQEPKRTTGLGAPDFKAFYKSRKVGFIETKDLNENLDRTLETEQLKKYIESIDNLILTNYLQFILIRKGRKIYDCSLLTLHDLEKGRLTVSEDRISMFISLISEFFDYRLPTITSAEELAFELSKRAKLLKELALKQLLEDLKKVENGDTPSSIYDFYQGVKELIKDIEVEDCADAYAQTVTYGLFLAKKNCPNTLDRRIASYYIPKNVGIIKRIFLNISGEEFPPNISWIVDDIIDILNASKLDEILTKIDKRGKKDKDPIIFFYEDFLNYYEPEKRKRLGVYYTPRPVVNFIVNSVHSVLKKYFDKPLGFADDSVNVLDPAIGTGTFFWIAYLVVLNELKNQGLRGIIFDKIRHHLLKHFYGFEILITPYVISHLKLTDLLQRWHYRFRNDDRIQVYLTNTLEPSEVHGFLPFLREITEESRVANQIKLQRPILVVMGNPPYAGESYNKGKWINDLLKKGYTRADDTKDDGYYKVDGKPLSEKNPKWLQDDYVKFIRYAQWKIDKNGEGVVGFITNHSYLDNPTFRGMRESLLQSFDRIYILNLHGNALKKEKCPDGSKDENVFDIKQGVAIGIFIKNKKLKEKKVFYADLWGSREDKYHWLDRHTIENVKWREIKPISPFYFFVPKDTALEEEYNKFWRITDIFPIYSVGIVTARDHFTIKWTPEEVWKTITEFIQMDVEDARRKFKLGEDARDWKVAFAQKDLKESGPDKNKIVPILYRPFDVRYTYYTGKSRGFHCMPRPEVMKHMLKENLGLCVGRQWSVIGSENYDIVFVTDKIVDFNFFRRGGELVFPLYLYSNSDKKPNFNHEFLKFITGKYNRELSPEEIFYYIYAVLYSPTYRKKYEEFLQYDFPRIPFVEDYEKFKNLSELGKELVELHLMRKSLPIRTKFDIQGSNVIEKVKYENGKVWINKEQYFEGVPEDVWNFYIGGYQVLDKWLKSRKNRKLESKDIEQFLQIVEIVRETIGLMGEIDKIKVA